LAAVNFAYLEDFLGGDKSVAAEVLQLFLKQSDAWTSGLDAANPDWRGVAHAIKGAARGVGADALGDACHQAEFGQPEDLPQVHVELARAMAEIEAYVGARS
jgi:HPt (histidine-containing phosphotransfer) domain-containing protein